MPKINPGLTRLKHEMLESEIFLKAALMPDMNYGQLQGIQNFRNGLKVEAESISGFQVPESFKQQIRKIRTITLFDGRTKSGKFSLLKGLQTNSGQNWINEFKAFWTNPKEAINTFALYELNRAKGSNPHKKLLEETLEVVRMVIPEIRPKYLKMYKKNCTIPPQSIFEGLSRYKTEENIPQETKKITRKTEYHNLNTNLGKFFIAIHR